MLSSGAPVAYASSALACVRNGESKLQPPLGSPAK